MVRHNIRFTDLLIGKVGIYYVCYVSDLLVGKGFYIQVFSMITFTDLHIGKGNYVLGVASHITY